MLTEKEKYDRVFGKMIQVIRVRLSPFAAVCSSRGIKDSALHHAQMTWKTGKKVCSLWGETVVVFHSPTKKVFLTVRNEWWRQHLATELENAPDCYIAQINSEFTVVISLDQIPPKNAWDH